MQITTLSKPATEDKLLTELPWLKNHIGRHGSTKIFTQTIDLDNYIILSEKCGDDCVFPGGRHERVNYLFLDSDGKIIDIAKPEKHDANTWDDTSPTIPGETLNRALQRLSASNLNREPAYILEQIETDETFTWKKIHTVTLYAPAEGLSFFKLSDTAFDNNEDNFASNSF